MYVYIQLYILYINSVHLDFSTPRRSWELIGFRALAENVAPIVLWGERHRRVQRQTHRKKAGTARHKLDIWCWARTSQQIHRNQQPYPAAAGGSINITFINLLICARTMRGLRIYILLAIGKHIYSRAIARTYSFMSFLLKFLAASDEGVSLYDDMV